MRFYVAGKWNESRDIREIMRGLVVMDHEITCDWTGHVHPEMSGKYSIEDIEGIKACDVLIAYMPNPDTFYKGAWVEFGAALALNKKVYVVGKGVSSVFLGHPGVKVFDDIADCLSYINTRGNNITFE